VAAADVAVEPGLSPVRNLFVTLLVIALFAGLQKSGAVAAAAIDLAKIVLMAVVALFAIVLLFAPARRVPIAPTVASRKR
jgi:uncharacterized membrane protein YtjA (UPF0391 family)